MNSKIVALVVGLPIALFAAPASANCNGGPFAGFYLGSTIGIAQSDGSISSPTAPKISGDDTSFAGSSVAGYNVQCDSVVLGVEGDIGHLGLENKGTWTDPAPAGATHLTDKIGWYGTLRGRAGVAVRSDTLLYVTGGLAFADVSHTLNTPAFGFSQKDSDWATGFTIGGGIEFLRHSNWLLRAEAMYVDLGDETHIYTVNGGGCVGVCTGTANWDDSFWVGRVGLSYKFGEAAVRHEPLK